ncbi:S1C family serine protease [Streptomyces sp. NPDC050529]|uniref:S1C family serine protease n=1 Tax=unclassified Streptomyces TaxID=2593676 RepID=UPI002DDBDB49|nr:trypsin-like peptidase domain-containing protein [Streptomyces sp. NBC_01022]WRZ83101.1 trypsin-like peptidase domain-containing protein [Streptomyces sp. NBC_01022]
MSTENEGNEGNAAEAAPSVPSAPPVPADAPQGLPESAPVAPPHPDATATQQQPAAPAQDPASPAQDPATAPMAPVPAAAPQYAPPPAPQSAAEAGWPPPPPAVPAYAHAHGAQGGGPAWGPPGQVQTPDAPRKRGAGGLVAAVVVAALVAGGVGGALGFWAADSNNSSDSSGSTTVSASGTPQDLKRDPGTVAGVAAKALPSVVTIDAQSGDGEGGTGTGFVYDKEGHILTNNHVVASAADSGQLTATFSNGKKYDAEVVGRAQGYDVAVLKLKNPPQGLAPLPLGNSDQVAVGDSTIAIGAPFGLSNTVTTGIISAKNRPVASGDGSGGSNSYMSALQTDASINPGNSGGPLLSAGGAVIGINSAIQSTGSTGQSQAGSIGLGFAIPINQAKNVAQQLIKTGQPVYPVIGATVTMDEKTGGAVISDQGAGGTEAVTKDGPAARAGLRAGDVITKFNDTVVDSGPTLIGEIWTHKPGDKVKLTYKRDGKTSTVEVTLGERKGDS